MAEKEYIEREAAKNAIFEYICGHTMSKFPSKELLKASKMGAEGAFIEIDYVPAADVVEVRHGEWHYNPDGMDWGLGAWQCSLCHCKNDNLPMQRNIKPLQWAGSKYCPNCGAKMDGGTK